MTQPSHPDQTLNLPGDAPATEGGAPLAATELPRSTPDDATMLQGAATTAIRPPGRGNVPQVEGYEILGELGRGGMGVVYKARYLALDRVVALKMILSGGHASAADLARFKAEALAVSRLQHANVVQIFAHGEQDGRPFFTLEFCA